MGKGKGGGNSSDYYREQEEQRQAAIRKGTKEIDATFGQFDDNFYDSRRQAYLDYAMPQLEDQRSKATRELTYSLARSGQLEGSARAQQSSELQKLYDTQAQSLADEALAQSTQARAGVEDARTGLLSTLNATGDATMAANSAVSRAEALSEPEAYSPLADMFASYTHSIGAADAAARARALGWGQTSTAATPTWYKNNSASVAVS